MAKKNKYTCFTVWRGSVPGIYDSWEACEAQVKGFAGAVYKGFKDRAAAEAAFHQDPALFMEKEKALTNGHILSKRKPNLKSLSVDAACSGNPGRLEYRGVDTGTGAEVFRVGPYEKGTVNIGEFLAIVHGLAFLGERDLNLPIYTDSKTAMKWVKDKKANTKLERDAVSEPLFQLVDRAERWLRNHSWRNPVLKWDTQSWGEIPADFGRK